MTVFDEIYTSAAQILDGGGTGDLGVVARTKGFPKELNAELSGQQAYNLLPELPLNNPNAHPPRLVVSARGLGRNWWCVSHVIFAGADHTGRTTPLAHHMAMSLKELDHRGTTPAAILHAAAAPASTHIFRQWEGPPRWIDPPRCFPEPAVWPNGEFPSPLWRRFPGTSGPELPVILATAADALIRFSKSQRPVVIVLPMEAGGAAMGLAADLLALLPRTLQNGLCVASHVAELADYVRDAALLFTYPNTTVGIKCAARRDPKAPLVIDLTRPPAEFMIPSPEGEYARLIRMGWDSPDRAGYLTTLTTEWDAVGATDPDTFAKLIGLRDRMLAADGKDMDGIAAAISESSVTPRIMTQIGNWAAEMSSHLANLPRTQCWWALADVWLDRRFPLCAQEAAQTLLMADSFNVASDLINDSPQGSVRQSAAHKIIAKLIEQQPSIVDVALDQATTLDAADAAIVAKTARIVAAAGNVPIATAIAWVDRTLRAHCPPDKGLLQSSLGRLNAACTSAAQLSPLLDHGRSDVAAPFFIGKALIPLLRHRLSREDSHSERDLIAEQLFVAGLADESEVRQLIFLKEKFSDLLTGERLRSWRARSATAADGLCRFEKAISEADLAHLLIPPSATVLTNTQPQLIAHDIQPPPLLERATFHQRTPFQPLHHRQQRPRWMFLIGSGTCFLLALLAGGLVAGLKFGPRFPLVGVHLHFETTWYLIAATVAAGATICWLLAECVLHWIQLSLRSRWVAYLVRAVVTLMLLAAVGAGGYAVKLEARCTNSVPKAPHSDKGKP